jgi:hypothetical protein
MFTTVIDDIMKRYTSVRASVRLLENGAESAAYYRKPAYQETSPLAIPDP